MINTGLILTIAGGALSVVGTIITGIGDSKTQSREMQEMADKISKDVIEQINKGTKFAKF